MALLHGNNSNAGSPHTRPLFKQRKAAYWGWRSPSKGPGDVKKEGVEGRTNVPCAVSTFVQAAGVTTSGRQSSNDAIIWTSLGVTGRCAPSAVRPCGCRQMARFRIASFCSFVVSNAKPRLRATAQLRSTVRAICMSAQRDAAP